MAKRKCVICGQYIEQDITDKENVIPYKDRYAHKTCFNNMLKVANKKKKEELHTKTKKKTNQPKKITVLKDGMTEEEFQQKKKFFKYVQNLLNVESLEAKHYQVSEAYIKKYKYTYLGMMYTLQYYFDYLGNELKGQDCIGIVPYYYNDAQSWNEKRNDTAEFNEKTIKQKDKVYTYHNIRISPPKPALDLIDIERIGVKNGE